MSKAHLKLGGNHGAFLGEALSFLDPRLAVGHAQNLDHRALLLARMAVAHRIVPGREDGSLQTTERNEIQQTNKAPCNSHATHARRDSIISAVSR